MYVDKPLLSEQQSDNIQCSIIIDEVKFSFVSIVMQITVNNAIQIMVRNNDSSFSEFPVKEALVPIFLF